MGVVLVCFNSFYYCFRDCIKSVQGYMSQRINNYSMLMSGVMQYRRVEYWWPEVSMWYSDPATTCRVNILTWGGNKRSCFPFHIMFDLLTNFLGNGNLI